jgi:hypothetical protein
MIEELSPLRVVADRTADIKKQTALLSAIFLDDTHALGFLGGGGGASGGASVFITSWELVKASLANCPWSLPFSSREQCWCPTPFAFAANAAWSEFCLASSLIPKI